MTQKVGAFNQQRTFGESRVGLGFNPGDESYVGVLKAHTAEILDLIDQSTPKKNLNERETSEWHRLKQLAMTAYEEGILWAEKASAI